MIARMPRLNQQRTGNLSGNETKDWENAVKNRLSGDRNLLIAAIEEGRDIVTTNEEPIHLSTGDIIYPIEWDDTQKVMYIAENKKKCVTKKKKLCIDIQSYNMSKL